MAFESVSHILERGITDRAFPCATIEVGCTEGVTWQGAFGRLMYGDEAPAATIDTVFDLASLTKVIATATVAMAAVERGLIGLDDRAADRLADWRGADRERVTIRDLLEHSSGLTAYLPFFRDHHGRAEFERAICTLPLEYAPRTQSIYSDLGFMLLAFILEDANRAPFASLFTSPGIVFNPPPDWRARSAPTELDTWRGRLLQGEVHDENCYVLGGAAGHAGLFATAPAVGAFARQVLRALRDTSSPEGLRYANGTSSPEGLRYANGTSSHERPSDASGTSDTGGPRNASGTSRPVGPRDSEAPERSAAVAQGFSPATLRTFTRKSSVPGSSRALAWDTMLPTSSCGTRLSPRAIGHTGFTGTSLWIDPELDLYVVLLTNRVHPTRDNNQIQAVRRRVHDAVVGSR